MRRGNAAISKVTNTFRSAGHLCAVAAACLILSACTAPPTPATPTPSNRTAPQTAPAQSPSTPTASKLSTPSPEPVVNSTATVAASTDSATASAPRPQRNAATLRALVASGDATISYTVQTWDKVSAIAGAIGTTSADVRRTNGLGNSGILIGETLTLRLPIRERLPALRLMPDSEVVNSPSAAQFSVADFMAQHPNAYLNKYTERFDGQSLRGPRIVERIAEQLSVHPRTLLALLEYSGGWITNPAPAGDQLRYPLGARGADRQTLSRQLSWAGARLNEGYYGWRLSNRLWVQFTDGGRAYVSDEVNAGSAALQNYLAAITTRAGWNAAVGAQGLLRTYAELFGDPWQYDLGVLVPDDLRQPEFLLPWEAHETWLATGGPHATWGVGSPWGGLDFTTLDGRGCGTFRGWVTAVADGVITRSVNGEVAQALDPSTDERIGWSVLYMHMGTRGRAKLGARVGVGAPIGHPSCEGGLSNGAHLHIARKYNGEWIEAAGNMPFVMSGWVPAAGEIEYDGSFSRGDESRTACECRDVSINGVSH